MRRATLIFFIAAIIVALAFVAPRAASAQYAFVGCRFNTTNLSFGRYDVFAKRDTTFAGIWTYSCSGINRNVSVWISPGQSGRYDKRYMTSANGRDRLYYQLSLDRSCERPVGNGFDGTDQISIGTSHETGVVDVFGIVYAGQNVSVGQYSDNLEVTINY